MKRIFIDTNVFVHWILYKKISEERPVDSSQMWKRYSRYKTDFEFIEQISESYGKVEYYTSGLAVTEIVFSIYRELKFRKMYLDGIPFSSFMKKADTQAFTLDEEDRKSVRGHVFLFLQEFGLFDTLGEKRKITLLRDDHNFLLVSDLIIKNNIATQDAILISTAVGKGCEYFVTSDKDLILLNKNNVKSLRELKFVNSTDIVGKIKS